MFNLHLVYYYKSKMGEHNETGRIGEEMAVRHLESKGYIILDMNYRFGPNEIDIVALEKEELVFVEVKTRRVHALDSGDVYPEHAVTRQKQQSCFKVADAYIYERRMLTVPVRFDVIAIRFYNSGEPEIAHYQDAFRDDTTLQSDIDIL